MQRHDLPAWLSAWCADRCGSVPVRVLFGLRRTSDVFGLKLADGRDVVVKAREAGGRAASCVAAQARLAERGFPCARPLTPVTRVGTSAVHAEEYRPGGGLLRGDSPDVAARYAAVFARLMAALADITVAPPLPNPRWARWDHTDSGVWPAIEELDVRDQGAVPRDVIDTATRVRARLRAADLPCVLGERGVRQRTATRSPRSSQWTAWSRMSDLGNTVPVMAIQKRWTESDRSFLRENFRKLTYKQIGEMLGRSWTSVRHQANAQGLTQGSNLGRKFSANLGFFGEPEPLNSYWAGFIAADGYVRGKRWTLGLGVKDASQVARLASDVGYTGPLWHEEGRCTLQISCQDHVDDLAKHFNITTRKSLTLEPPNIIGGDEIRAFITGVIDGDGCISMNRYRHYVRPRITIYGTVGMLEWIRDHFNEWSPPDARRTSGVRKIPGERLHAYSVTARRAVEVSRALHQVDVPRLARKWDRIPLS